MKQLLQPLWNLSRKEKFFILSAFFCSLLITAEYAIIRPISNAFFLGAYGSSAFPYAWLAAVPINLVAVTLYNKFLPRLGYLRMAFLVFSLIAGGTLLSFLFIDTGHYVPFCYYVWKEIYILFLFQQLWSLIHATVSLERAKFLYGVFYAVGGLGATLGSCIPGFLAVKMGSANLLLFCFPLYLLLGLATFFLHKNSGLTGEGSEQFAKEPVPLRESFKVITSSSFLPFILFIVLFMQLSATLVDFQFNTLLESSIAETDLRTEYSGKVHSLINIATVVLQCIGTMALLQFLGVRRSHYFVPMTLCINAVAFLFFPLFGVITFSYIAIKSIDFSLFGVIKEMLYIPTKLDEKFRGKAFIDIFAYRAAKALASFLIIALQFFPGVSALTVTSIGLIAIFLAWAFLVSKMFGQKASSIL